MKWRRKIGEEFSNRLKIKLNLTGLRKRTLMRTQLSKHYGRKSEGTKSQKKSKSTWTSLNNKPKKTLKNKRQC
jgi:hypothetical protein